jgi:hypothetical protein
MKVCFSPVFPRIRRLLNFCAVWEGALACSGLSGAFLVFGAAGREDSSTNATSGTSDCKEIKQVIVNFEQIYSFWTNVTSDCEF